jgi:lincosamide nucleotidyltransferase A/C/D/E
MRENDVCNVLEWLELVGVDVWVDGGWGVDAPVGEQTRPHSDLDLALNVADLDLARKELERHTFQHDEAIQPGLPARLVMRDEEGREVDLHPLTFDPAGNGWQELSTSGRAWGHYPADDLQAAGVIGGRRVHCLSPQLQLQFRMGYEWSERDEQDVRLLIERFAAPAPPPFERNRD